jgi:DNA-binding transcriptional ArsR family regulator
MSDPASPQTVTASVPGATSFPNFASNPVRLLQALADPIRHAVLRELAAGRSRSVQELAGVLKRDPDLVSKHLRVLRDAGAVVVVPAPDGDGRKQHHAVPEAYRRVEPAGGPVIDYGVCVLRFG